MKTPPRLPVLLLATLALTPTARAIVAADETLATTVEFQAPSYSVNLAPNNIYPCVATWRGSTFFVWADSARRPHVTRRDPAGVITTVPLDTSPDYVARDDGHHKFSLGIDSAGYLHVTGDMHRYPLSSTDHLPARYQNQKVLYWRSAAPADLSAGFLFLGAPTDARAFPAIFDTGFTYAGFRTDRLGALYWSCRGNAAVSNPRAHFVGETGVLLYKYNPSTQRWTALGAFPPAINPGPGRTIAYNKVLAWEDNGHASATFYQGFCAGLAFDELNRLHFAVPINNDTTIDAPTHVLYARSDDGGATWKKASGTAAALPLRVDGAQPADIVFSGGTCDITATVAIDATGKPGVVYSPSPYNNPGDYRYWTGSAWSTPANNPVGDYLRGIAHLGPDDVLTFLGPTLRRTDALDLATYGFSTGLTSVSTLDQRALQDTGVLRFTGLRDGKLTLARVNVSTKGDFLSTLNWTSWTGYQAPRKNLDRDGGGLEIEGVSYSSGLGTHANSDVTYNISGLGYRDFQAIIGVDDDVGSAGSIVFRVHVDGVQLHDSGTMTGSTPSRFISIPVTGAATLRLQILDAGNGTASDHANWALAKLTKR